MATAAHLDETITAAVSDPQIATVSVDLAGVTFIDSTAVNTLIRGLHRAKHHECSFGVVNARDMVRRVFEVTGVLDVLTRQTTDAAVPQNAVPAHPSAGTRNTHGWTRTTGQ